MQPPVLITPPAAALVSLAEGLDQLFITYSSSAPEDAPEAPQVARLIEAVTSHLDGYSGTLGRALVTQTWMQPFYFWHRPAATAASAFLRLPLAPVQSVAITYLDPAGDEHPLDPSRYSLERDGFGPFVRLHLGLPLPALAPAADAVRIAFVAGYGDPADVPAAIRHAALLLLGHYYEHREAVTPSAASPLPLGVKALLDPFRRVGFAG